MRVDHPAPRAAGPASSPNRPAPPSEPYGLRLLKAKGWDPDSGKGLGARGDGIRIPIKAVPKNDTAGVGVDTKKLRAEGRKILDSIESGKVKKMNAKECRQQHDRDKKRQRELERAFNGNGDPDEFFRILGRK